MGAMSKTIFVQKSSGVVEPFNALKLRGSLARSGASEQTIDAIVARIEDDMVDGVKTSAIYSRAFSLLKQLSRTVASRYSIRRAVMELGPNGFPFEQFIAEILKVKGYETATDQIVLGKCVDHEMDVVAWKEKELIMVEAKFHNQTGFKSDIKTALYIKARFEDLTETEFEYGGKHRKMTEGWLVTNTKFTEHAIRYGECNNLKLIGWNYPKGGNLEDLINETHLHPLTCLTSLSTKDKQTLLKNGFVLCRDIENKTDALKSFGIDSRKIPVIFEEIQTLYESGI
jgi:hypothetical protein